MKNCLVTKLLASVDNPNLEKLGEIKLRVKNNTEGVASSFKFAPNNNGETIVITCEDGTACLYTSVDSTRKASITLTGNISAYIDTDVERVFSITNKYGIQRASLRCSAEDTAFDLNDAFDYSASLQNVDIVNDPISPLKVTGNLNTLLQRCSQIFGFNFVRCEELEFDLNEAGLHVGGPLEFINNLSSCTGTIQGFVTNARTIMTSGQLNYGSSFFRLNDGTTGYMKANGLIKWTADTITVEASSGDIVLNE